MTLREHNILSVGFTTILSALVVLASGAGDGAIKTSVLRADAGASSQFSSDVNSAFSSAFSSNQSTVFSSAFNSIFSSAFSTQQSTLFSSAFSSPQSTLFSSAFSSKQSTVFSSAFSSATSRQSAQRTSSIIVPRSSERSSATSRRSVERSSLSRSRTSFGFSRTSRSQFNSHGDFGGLIGGDFGGIGGGNFGGSIGGGGVYEEGDTKPADPSVCGIERGKRACVPLIAPLGELDRIDVEPGAGTIISYFNDIASFLFYVAVGFCTLWVLIGTYFIMISGSDGGKRSKGKEIITWAIIGLVIVNFAGFILRTLNDIFFI